MDEILKSLDLNHLKEKFQNEGINPHTITQLTKEQLCQLDVTRLGDRLRLQDTCRRYSSGEGIPRHDNQDGQNSSRRRTFVERIASERSTLFAPYTHSNTTHRSKIRKKKMLGRSWTANFYCLSNPFQRSTPTLKEKEILQSAGLGNKKIKLTLDDDEHMLYKKLLSDEVDEDGELVGFPRLREGGGFELLKCPPNSKSLSVIKSPTLNVKDIKATLGSSQCKLYVRPIQKSLDITPIEVNRVSTLKEKCHTCGEEVLLTHLRKHKQNHFEAEIKEPSTSEESDSDVSLPEMHPRRSNSTEQDHISPNQNSCIVIEPDDSPRSTEDPSTLNVPEADVLENIYSAQVELVINDLLKTQTLDPTACLRKMQEKLVKGRPLEIRELNDQITGKTSDIYVSRSDILNSGLSEVKDIDDKSLTLDVQFYGEEAEDYSGPRKEFFTLMLREIFTKYFEKGLIDELSEDYVTIGILFGLSILQNGKIPKFLPEDLLQQVFSTKEDIMLPLKKLREGLKEMGIYQVGIAIPTFLMILRPNDNDIVTFKKLITLLKPNFDETGSNQRKYQEEIYGEFLK